MDIWLLHWRSPLGDLLPAAFIVVAVIRRGETLASLGLTPAQAVNAVRAWRWVLVPCAAAAVAGCFGSERPAYLLFRGAMYLVWCVLQQVLLDNLVYRRLRMDLGPTWTACLIAGALFAATHLPNPVLVPATLLWGIASARLFERWRSAIALGLLQTFLSAFLLWATPAGLNQQFRVGPGYWHAHQRPQPIAEGQ